IRNAAMKRPQFGLRLMLLVVALFAAIIGWQSALFRLRQIDRKGEREGAQIFHKYLVDLKTRLDDQVKNGSQSEAQLAASELPWVNKSIDEWKDKIENLSK